MARSSPGTPPLTADLLPAPQTVSRLGSPRPLDTRDFDYLFWSLQDDAESLLPRAADTPAKLDALSRAVGDDKPPDRDSTIPAAYAAFGQFLHRDLTPEVHGPATTRTERGTRVQLHAAFLEAHNALVDEGRGRGEAERMLRRHYQHLVIHDFLRRIAEPAIVDDIVTNGNQWFNALAEPFFMPLEFAAAYPFGQPRGGGAATLLRGYALRVPTGQAVAAYLGLPVLTPAQVITAAGPGQADALAAGGFEARTPLSYYVLAEAKHHGGDRLGPVGSTLVAEVLVGLVRRSADSILATPGWMPTMPSGVPGRFELADLLRFAGGLGARAPSTAYVVMAGDTLCTIAAHRLNDASRWPEIFLANRASIRHPHRISSGQILTLPTGPKLVPQPRIHVAERGDTLTNLASALLGQDRRWTEIFELNRTIITNPDVIVPDTVLLIPAT